MNATPTNERTTETLQASGEQMREACAAQGLPLIHSGSSPQPGTPSERAPGIDVQAYVNGGRYLNETHERASGLEWVVSAEHKGGGYYRLIDAPYGGARFVPHRPMPVALEALAEAATAELRQRVEGRKAGMLYPGDEGYVPRTPEQAAQEMYDGLMAKAAAREVTAGAAFRVDQINRKVAADHLAARGTIDLDAIGMRPGPVERIDSRPTATVVVEQIEVAFKQLRAVLDTAVPGSSRAKACAITRLDEARFWALEAHKDDVHDRLMTEAARQQAAALGAGSP